MTNDVEGVTMIEETELHVAIDLLISEDQSVSMETVEEEITNAKIGRRVSSRHADKKRPFYGQASMKKSMKKREKVVVIDTNAVENLVDNQNQENVVVNDNINAAENLGNQGQENLEEEIVNENSVKKALRLFNEHHLELLQEKKERCNKAKKERAKKGENLSVKKEKRTVDRPDLKAVTMMIGKNEVVNRVKRIGDIPDIEVGHVFCSRAEMYVVGLHRHLMRGIDYMAAPGYSKMDEYSGYKFPIAVAVVISGLYEDDRDTLHKVEYTGEGQNNLLGDKRQGGDQLMLRGNLALQNNIKQKVPVRVIRGHKLKSSYSGKVYTYDGLYNVDSYEEEEGVSGFSVLKFVLSRIEGQPALTTNRVHSVREQASEHVPEQVVCDDICGGLETLAIPAFSPFGDSSAGPTGYTYCSSIQLADGVTLPAADTGCSCKGACTDPNKCSCAKLNGGSFPYVDADGGRLIRKKPVVFECGPSCKCGPNCVNKTSQHGLRFHLEVFQTRNKGWAVRSQDFIPAGAPVCEYTGTLIRTKDLDDVSENSYIFEIDCLERMKGKIGKKSRRGAVSEPEFCIDAGTSGGVARFINHSCDPNLFVQCVVSPNKDFQRARVILMAFDNIPRLQELAYDYNYTLNSVTDSDGKITVLPCHCGGKNCRKRLY